MSSRVPCSFQVQTIDGLARSLGLNKFLQLSYDAGLLDKLASSTEMTLFAPSDDAFSGILPLFDSSNSRYNL